MKLTKTFTEREDDWIRRQRAKTGVYKRYAWFPTFMNNGSLIWLEKYQHTLQMSGFSLVQSKIRIVK